jgi:hypothetical protein
MIIELIREIYTKQATLGKMYIDGEYFCYTLEDTVRPNGIKVKHHTAIPEGTYKVTLTYSNRFKRIMALIQDVPMFSGIRIHGGNTHENTSGCPLIAYNKLADDKIQGTAEKDFTLKVKYAIMNNEDVTITILNKLP